MQLDKRKSPSGLSPGSGSPSGLAFGAIPLVQGNCTTDLTKTQPTAYSAIDTEKYTSKKQRSLLLADSYDRLGYETKAARVRDCGVFLTFTQEIKPGLELSSPKLTWANFCKDRLCPMCTWRRSVKLFQNLAAIVDVTGTDYEYVLFTLTRPNCPGDDLPEVLDSMTSAFRKLMQYKDMKVFLGWARTLEITRNKYNGSFHPHFHVLAAVPLGYGSSRQYVSQKRLLELWQRAAHDPSIKIVDIRKVKDFHGQIATDTKQLIGAVKETCKYSTKDTDYILPSNHDLTDTIVSDLAPALKGRRLFALGGIFKEINKTLALNNPEDDNADLTDSDRLNPLGVWLVTKCHWTGIGYTDYLTEVLDLETRDTLKLFRILKKKGMI